MKCLSHLRPLIFSLPAIECNSLPLSRLSLTKLKLINDNITCKPYIYFDNFNLAHHLCHQGFMCKASFTRSILQQCNNHLHNLPSV